MSHFIIIVCLLFTASILGENNDDSKKGYHQLGPGIYISNNNSQSLNFEETKREVQVRVEKTQSQPTFSNTTYAPTQQQPPLAPNNYAPNNNPFTLGEKTKDYFSYYATHFQTFPEKFLTLKNCAFAVGIIACGYGILYFKLLRHIKNVTKSNGWASFQEHIPPLQLSTLDILVLADGIIEEIKSRYPLVNPENLMPSLLLFNKDVEEELEELFSYLEFYNRLATCKMTFLFPDQKKILEKAHSRIQRLHLLKKALEAWINNHTIRLVHNQRIPRQSEKRERNSHPLT